MQEQAVLERGNGLAVWRQIEKAITEEIRQRLYMPGDRLPNEHTLAARFGVNRHTVRRALHVLEQHGVLRVEQGKGTFVRERAIDYMIAKRTRFSHNIQHLGYSSIIELIQATELAATKEVASALGLRVGAPVIELVTLGKAEQQALNLATNYFSFKRFAAYGAQGLAAQVKATGSITQALQHCGIADYTRGPTRVMARLPDATTARYLAQSPAQPVLLVESVNLDDAGAVFQFSKTVFAGDSVQILFDPNQV